MKGTWEESDTRNENFGLNITSLIKVRENVYFLYKFFETYVLKSENDY